MKKGFYLKLAASGIRKNRETYFPYLLTCIGMVMMYYIISFLSADPGLREMSGGRQMEVILGFGVWVMAVFSVIFLFYTNSFLIRRRKKEFGLYNILGMNKWNLSRILIWETVLCFVISAAVGLGCGILFSRLAQFAMVKLMGANAILHFTLLPQPIRDTIVLFAAVFGVMFLNTLRQIHLSNPIELLHSEQTGEKPPKANWFLAVVGALLLGGAYYLAITIESPSDALFWFFVAVLMVIAATYLLFVSGSVAVCALLQKWKRYYYQTSHFVSTSFMSYRMKRNGAGLASICILSTMVLVMLSSTGSLYIGEEDMLQDIYQRDIVVSIPYFDEEISQENENLIQEKIEKSGLTSSDGIYTRYLSFACYEQEGELILNRDRTRGLENSTIRSVCVMPVSVYNAFTGSEETLKKGEALLSICNETEGYEGNTIRIEGCEPFSIVKRMDDIGELSKTIYTMTQVLYVFVPGMEEMQMVQDALYANITLEAVPVIWESFGFDLNGNDSAQLALSDEIFQTLIQKGYSASVQSRAENRADFYGSYAGLFFLGILLGIVFLFAVALIMYYKQIIEGHEDSGRFEILQKVGMTETEVRGSINSSVLTVFFLPLAGAGCHTLAAFPMVSRMLSLFNMRDTRLFLMTLLFCFLVFAAFYAVMYWLTSKAYYRIVKR